jgi:hypothetical protein
VISARRLASPLRLPAGSTETSSALSPDGLRARLEELARRSFSGRIELRADDWLADLLLCDGRPVAAALGGPGLEQPLVGQPALEALVGQASVPWTCGLETMDSALLAALAGLAAEPRVCRIATSENLRILLRELVSREQDGLLELSVGARWGRVALSGGRLLGAYTSDAPELVMSLAQLGDLMAAEVPLVAWYPASAATFLAIPASPASVGAGPAEVERQVIWIVSRFEGAWGRARERGGLADDFQEALARMLDELLRLAADLENTRGDPLALEAALACLSEAEAEPRPLVEIDRRLDDLTPQRACPLLVELVAEALRRIVWSCPEPNLAEFCRQTAQALDDELRTAFPTQSTVGAGAGGVG